MDINSRTTSSVNTSATDSSPKCVALIWAGAAEEDDPEGVVVSAMRNANDEPTPPIGRYLQPIMNNQKQEWKSVEPCDDDGENHEVELKDVSGMFGGDGDKGNKGNEGNEGNKEEEEEEGEIVHESSRGMKKFMSRVALNPKLKKFMSSRTLGKDDRVAESVYDESVEISLMQELEQSERSVSSRESNLAITKEGGTCAGGLEVGEEAAAEEAEFLKAEACAANKAEENSSNEGSSNEYTPSNPRSDFSKLELSEFDSGEKDQVKGMKRLLSRVKLNSRHRSFSKVFKLNRKDSVETPSYDTHQDSKCFNENESTTMSNEPGFLFEDFEIYDTNDSKHSSNESNVDEVAIVREDCSCAERVAEALEPEVSHADKTTEDDLRGDEPFEVEAPEFDSGEKEGVKGMKRLMSRVKLNPKIRSFISPKASESNRNKPCVASNESNEYGFEIAEEDVSVGGRLEVVNESEVLEANGETAKIADSGWEEVVVEQSKQCVKNIKNDAKTIPDDNDEDDKGDGFNPQKKNMFYADELESLNEDASCSSSDIDMSVFSGTTKGREGVPAVEEERATGKKRTTEEERTVEEERSAEEQPTVEEQKEKPPEFRQMKVTLKFKALAGVSQVTSRKKPNFQNGNGIDDTVKVVVTYRRNTVASDKFVSTHVPSLPIFLERTPDLANSQVYAQWPGGPKDDDSNATSFLMSSVALTRTMRRVRNFGCLSSEATAGGSQSQVKEPKEEDSKKFLASLSKAFAPELLDLQVGLMRGSSEIIPLGIATVVIPGEYKRMQLDIPVVRNYCTGESALSKNKITHIRGKKKSSKDHVFFSDDKDTKYKINEGAFLRLELKIVPTETPPAAQFLPRHLNTNTCRADFRSGPISRALRRRRKTDLLLSAKKLPLHQRIQMYLELRNRKGRNGNNTSPNSKEVDITRQTDVSEVSCEMQEISSIKEVFNMDDMSASLIMDQYDSGSWASSVPSKDSDSPLVTRAVAEADEQDGRLSLASQHSATLFFQPKEAPESTASVTTVGTNRQDGMLSLASERSGASAKLSIQSKEKPVSVSSLLAKEQDGRLRPGSQDSAQGDNLTQFSSSLYSVFTTNHPQKQTIVQSTMDLLGCEPNGLVLCEKERNALKYYACEQEEQQFDQWCPPYVHDEFSALDTYAEEDTLASLESLSVTDDGQHVELEIENNV